jgi:hypothetical protein
VKEFVTRRWKPLVLAALLLAGYALDKFAPQLELERKLLAGLQTIVEGLEP